MEQPKSRAGLARGFTLLELLVVRGRRAGPEDGGAALIAAVPRAPDDVEAAARGRAVARRRQGRRRGSLSSARSRAMLGACTATIHEWVAS